MFHVEHSQINWQDLERVKLVPHTQTVKDKKSLPGQKTLEFPRFFGVSLSDLKRVYHPLARMF